MPREDIQVGMTLWTAAGRKLGKIVGVAHDRVLLSRGLLSPHDYVAPTRGIESRDGRAILTDEAGLQPWQAEQDFVEAPQWARDRGEEMEVALHEEELIAEKAPRVRGHIRVHKKVITEERTVRVQVRREELRIERVDAPLGDATELAASAQTVLGEPLVENESYLPLYEDEIEIVKRPKVREWVRVTKELIAKPRTYAGQVRREVASVDADRGITVHTDND